MIDLKILLPLCGLALCTAAIAADRDTLHLYVLALTAGVEAEKQCAGMERDFTGISYLIDRAQRGRFSDAEVDEDIARTKIDIQRAIYYKGAAEWCSSAWRLFGPDGFHAIKRK